MLILPKSPIQGALSKLAAPPLQKEKIFFLLEQENHTFILLYLYVL